MGGDCLNYRLRAVEGADRRRQARARPRRGCAFRRDGRSGRRRFRARCTSTCTDVIAAIAPNDSKARFTGLGVRVIEAAARFKDRAPSWSATASRSRRAASSSPPARRRRCRRSPASTQTPYLTNETVFDLAALAGAPDRHRRAARSGSSWRRRFAGSAPRSPCSKRRRRLPRDDPECAADRARAARARGRRVPRRRRRRARRGVRRDGCSVVIRAGAAARRRSTAAICWSRPAAPPMSRGSVSTQAGISCGPPRHRRRQRAADHEQARLCHRRRRRRGAVHPRSPTTMPGS